jgi:long-chain acyl-CoA synthetase
MPTELDQRARYDSITAITAEGSALLPPSRFERGGVDNARLSPGAPPTMAHLIAHFCTQSEHKDVECSWSMATCPPHLWPRSMLPPRPALAQGLVPPKHGIEKGDRVGIAARNSANWMIADTGDH